MVHVIRTFLFWYKMCKIKREKLMWNVVKCWKGAALTKDLRCATSNPYIQHRRSSGRASKQASNSKEKNKCFREISLLYTRMIYRFVILAILVFRRSCSSISSAYSISSSATVHKNIAREHRPEHITNNTGKYNLKNEFHPEDN